MARSFTLCFMAVALLVGAQVWAQVPITRASVSSAAVEGNRPSDDPSLSRDGQFIAFSSRATNLVTGDSNDVADVFVHDRQTRQTTRVSVSDTGAQGNGDSLWPAISADGRLVAFYSDATNLVTGDTNGAGDIFVHDRLTGQTTRVSVATGGVQSTGVARDRPAISGDGRYAAFASAAVNLVPGDTNGAVDIFVHERQTGQTTRVSVTSTGVQADDNSLRVSLSADGSHVVFLSYARNLVSGGDGGLTPDVFVYSRTTGQHTRVRIPFEARLGSVVPEISTSAISADGRILTFNSMLPSGSIVPAGEPVAVSVFAHDLVTGQTTTVATQRVMGAAPLFGAPSIGSSGNAIAFAAADPLTCPGVEANTCPHRVYVYDRIRGLSTRADVQRAGSPEESVSSQSAVISRDDSTVAFASEITALLPGQPDNNGVRDVFVVGTLTDTDGDGMPDGWETQFGLNPLVNDAAADPDGDGLTNLQEWQVGTHPRGLETRYLAEGATSTFFDTSIALVNPGSTPATVLLRFLTRTGATASRVVQLPALGRRTVDVKTVPGLAMAEFSTVIEADALVVVDRTMQWDRNGYGSHAEAAIASPAMTWYFAEGATHSGFGLFYLVQNPSDQPTVVEVTYLRPAPAPPLVKTYPVAALSRLNIWVNNEAATDPRLAGLANADLSAVVRSTTSPVIVERAMYLNSGGLTFGAGHGSAGVTSPATRWFLAEGATGAYFDLFVLLANPNVEASEVRATFLLPTGQTLTKTYTVPGQSRSNIWVDVEKFPDDTGTALLSNTSVSTTIEVTNGVPIIVERAMWWPGPTSATWQEAHNSPGATETGTRWALADGELGGERASETFILIANTSAREGLARVTLLFEDGTRAEREFELTASSRFNVEVAVEFPVARDRRFGALIESVGTAPVEIVVERAMYSDADGVSWAAGTNALATRLP